MYVIVVPGARGGGPGPRGGKSQVPHTHRGPTKACTDLQMASICYLYLVGEGGGGAGLHLAGGECLPQQRD